MIKYIRYPMGIFRIDSGKIFKKMAGLNVLNVNDSRKNIF
jgi:hypothetical protein